MNGSQLKIVGSRSSDAPVRGSAGIPCHAPGCSATVSALADLSGGIRPGLIIEPS